MGGHGPRAQERAARQRGARGTRGAHSDKEADGLDLNGEIRVPHRVRVEHVDVPRADLGEHTMYSHLLCKAACSPTIAAGHCGDACRPRARAETRRTRRTSRAGFMARWIAKRSWSLGVRCRLSGTARNSRSTPASFFSSSKRSSTSATGTSKRACRAAAKLSVRGLSPGREAVQHVAR